MTPNFAPDPEKARKAPPANCAHEDLGNISPPAAADTRQSAQGPGQILWPEKAARLKENAPVLDRKFELYEKFGRTPGLLILEGGIALFTQPAGIIVNYIEGHEPSAALKREITEAAKPHPVIFGMRPKEVVDAYTPTLGEESPASPFKDRLGADAIILSRHEELWKRCCGTGYVHGGGYHPHHDRTPELFLLLTKGVEVPESFKEELRQIAAPYKLEFEVRGIMRVGGNEESKRARQDGRKEEKGPLDAQSAAEDAPASTLWQRFKKWWSGA